ncbi:MAG: cysteine--tRNA ligase [Saezia sp.]
MALHIYNTMGRKLEPFAPLNPKQVRMYVCGMTVYDYCHIGHARVMVVFDVIQRWLKKSGFEVTYVRNITDIDDKIINRALENKESIKDLTNRMIAAMHEDADRLLIERPTHEPRATDYIPNMLAIIERLQEKGLAYQAKSGDVDYSVRKFAEYGKLSGKSIDELRAGERVAVLEDKQDPLDFVLWKKSKEGEPAEVKWKSPYGLGRPGWHIECSAMSHALLGESFDIHGGGADLQFPHHENEIAQSEGAFDKTMARYWVHNGFVRVDGEKMSKSLGNFFTIRDVLAHYDPETVRFFIIRAHYRSPLNYSDAHLDDAHAALTRLYTTLSSVPSGSAKPDLGLDFVKRFTAAMDDDFNTPEAVAVLFDLATEVNRTQSGELSALLRYLGGILGVLQREPAEFMQAGSSDEERVWIEQMIDARHAAKVAKDYAKADVIRTELLEKGVELKDSSEGTTWSRKA